MIPNDITTTETIVNIDCPIRLTNQFMLSFVVGYFTHIKLIIHGEKVSEIKSVSDSSNQFRNLIHVRPRLFARHEVKSTLSSLVVLRRVAAKLLDI